LRRNPTGTGSIIRKEERMWVSGPKQAIDIQTIDTDQAQNNGGTLGPAVGKKPGGGS